MTPKVPNLPEGGTGFSLCLVPIRHLSHRAITLLRAILDEIFDQSAYRRHLSAHNIEHSGPEWRKFQDHHLSAKSRRARCC
jgi:hypothetical protein